MLLRPQAIGENGGEVFLGREWSQSESVSQSTSQLVDSEIKAFIDEAHKRCHEIISTRLDKLHAIAAALLERETITGEDIQCILDDRPLPPFNINDDYQGQTKKKDESNSDESKPSADSKKSENADTDTFTWGESEDAKPLEDKESDMPKQENEENKVGDANNGDASNSDAGNGDANSDKNK